MLPLVRHLRSAAPGTWRRDVVAGVVLSALLVPAGMAYAEASGLPAVNGLYATIVPLTVYALLGPSRVLVVGPDSSLAPLVLVAVAPLAATAERSVALAGLLAVLAGGFALAAGLARLGFVADLLSVPVRTGYLNGIAVTVVVSQLPRLLGFSVAADGVPAAAVAVVDGVRDGLVVGWAAAIGIGVVVLLLTCRRFAPRWPATLLAIVSATAVVTLADLHDTGLRLLGRLPQGLPTPALAGVTWSDARVLLASAFGIALVSFADTSTLSRSLAMRRRERVDMDRELAALGAVNVASGMLGGFPVSASSSRTPVAADAGASSQLAGLVGAGIVLLLVVAAPGLFADLPLPALAGVVIVAAFGLVDISGPRHMWSARRTDVAICVLTTVGVVVVGVLPGIVIAVGASVLDLLRRAWRPHVAELVRVDGVKGYHDSDRHPEGVAVPGLLLIRFDAPLFFANATTFVDDVLRRLERSARPVQRVVVTAEPITDIDSTAAAELDHLFDVLDERGVELGFAELKGHVRDRFAAFGLLDRVPDRLLHRTTGEAVKVHVADHGLSWVDWQDRPDAT